MQIQNKEVEIKNQLLVKDFRIIWNLNERKDKGDLSETDLTFEILENMIVSVDWDNSKQTIKIFIENLEITEFTKLSEIVGGNIGKIMENVKKK